MKEIVKTMKVNLIGGKAVPGPKLSSAGINMGKFIKDFNDATKDRVGEIVPTIINVFKDKTYEFILKKTPITQLLFKAANIDKGAKDNKSKVGKVTAKQIEEIAKYKLDELNCDSLESAKKIVSASAINMGIEIEN